MIKRTRYKLYRLMAMVVLSLAIMPTFTGCLGLYQPKAYIEITKPPMRVIYLDYHKNISPIDIDMIMNNMKGVKYHPYKFNDKNDINVNYDAGLATDHSKSVTINNNKKDK